MIFRAKEMVPLFARRTLEALADAAGPARAPAGRSLWQDARARFFRNRAAVASLAVLVLVAAFALLGDLGASWSNEEIDWAMLGSVAQTGPPSLANGHWFGVDELGRDLFARTVQGTRILARGRHRRGPHLGPRGDALRGDGGVFSAGALMR